MSFEDIKKHVAGQNNNNKKVEDKTGKHAVSNLKKLEKEMMERDDRHPENSTLEKNAGEIEIAPMIDPEREGM